jgi:aryl-alcohol dehydrogenase-like predicted oxidoreductase
MEMRFLGASGLQVSTLSFGAMTFSDGTGRFASVGGSHGEEARRLIDICIEAGVNLFDTADVYAEGRSEEILGQALGARRKDVLVATKAFGRMGRGAHDHGLSRRHLVEACEASLRRLGTDWIDLYQVHNFDSLTPVEETLRALDDLVRAGKVRYIGCSNHAGWQLMKTLGVSERAGLARYVGQQIQYSLLVRDAEQELLPAGVDQGVGALIWSPLAQGYLSGKFRAADAGAAPTRLTASGGVKAWDTERGRHVVDVLVEVAAAHPGASPSQAALNWLLARPGVSTVIVGARSEAQLRDNLAAASWSLTAEDIRRLDLASQTPVVYPNSHQRFYSADRNPQLFPRIKSEGAAS